VTLPDKDQALQFAIMLQAGLPARDAIVYFAQTDDPTELGRQLASWVSSRAVREAVSTLQGKSWQEMSLKEKMNSALDQHYAGLAYYLYSNNYSDLGPQERAKADTARVAIEQKVAGTAGKLNALEEFFTDVKSGPVKLSQQATMRLPEA
jgi:hypothetical protein